MCLETTFVSKSEHLIVYPGRISDTKHGDTPIDQFFCNPIHRRITLGRHHHLIFTVKGFINSLHQCRRLTGSRRSVYDSHLFCTQHLIHCLLLRSIQPGETHRTGLPPKCRCFTQQYLPQTSRTIPLCLCHLTQGSEHRLIRSIVKVQLYPQLTRND